MFPWLIEGAIALAKEFIPDMVSHVAGDTGGKVAEKVIGIAADVTGIKVGGADDVSKVMDALRANPGLLTEYKTRMASIALEETKAYLDDRADARGRDVEITKAGRVNWRADMMVAVAFVSITIICVVMLVVSKIDAGVMTFLTTIGGMMMKNISTAYDFEFGSSRGSKGKSEDMGNLLNLLSKNKRES